MVGPYKISDLTLEEEPAPDAVFELQGPDGLPYRVPAEFVAHAAGLLGRRNLIINGGMELSQRWDTTVDNSLTGISTRAYGPDRWSVMNENAGVNYRRFDTSMNPNFTLKSRYYSKLTKITASGQMGMYQIIEGAEIASLWGKKVRVSVKLRRAVAFSMDTFVCLLQLNSAGTVDTVPAALASAYAQPTAPYVTLGANLAMIGTGSGVIPTSTNWLDITFTETVPTTAKNLILLIVTIGQANPLDELYIGEAGVYAGGSLATWVNEPLGDIIQKCQRFYAKTFPIDQAPIQNYSTLGSKRASIKIAGAVTTSWQGEEWRFPVRMRGIPTITFYNPGAANAFARNLTLLTNATATSANNITDMSCHLHCTGLAAWVVGNDSSVHITADAEL